MLSKEASPLLKTHSEDGFCISTSKTFRNKLIKFWEYIFHSKSVDTVVSISPKTAYFLVVYFSKFWLFLDKKYSYISVHNKTQGFLVKSILIPACILRCCNYIMVIYKLSRINTWCSEIRAINLPGRSRSKNNTKTIILSKMHLDGSWQLKLPMFCLY